MIWKFFLVAWEIYIVNATSWAHVLPSPFIQQVPPRAAPRAWILLIDSAIFCQSVVWDTHICLSITMQHSQLNKKMTKNSRICGHV